MHDVLARRDKSGEDCPVPHGVGLVETNSVPFPLCANIEAPAVRYELAANCQIVVSRVISTCTEPPVRVAISFGLEVPSTGVGVGTDHLRQKILSHLEAGCPTKVVQASASGRAGETV